MIGLAAGLELFGIALTLLGVFDLTKVLEKVLAGSEEAVQSLEQRWRRRQGEHELIDTLGITDSITAVLTRGSPDRTATSERDWLVSLDRELLAVREEVLQLYENQGKDLESMQDVVKANQVSQRAELASNARRGRWLVVSGLAFQAAAVIAALLA